MLLFSILIISTIFVLMLKLGLLRYFLFGTAILLFSACQRKATKSIATPSEPIIKTKPKALNFQDSLQYLMTRSFGESQDLNGFIIYDPEKRDTVYAKNAAKYFTPASNVKILTLLTALEILGPTMTSISYHLKSDTLVFKGTGYPLLLNSEIIDDGELLYLLKKHNGPIYFDPSNFQDNHYGSGWSWDDYPYLYQTEKSALPIYANSVWISKANQSSRINVDPSYFKKHLRVNPGDEFSIKRNFKDNNILIEIDSSQDQLINKTYPFVYSDDLLVQLLSDTLNKPVGIWDKNPLPKGKQMKGFTTDSLYQIMMHFSDNFIAEQLLLNCSYEVFDTMSTSKIIAYTKDEILKNIPDQMRWVDGSGLSRYNLITPRNLSYVLQRIKNKIGPDGIERLFSRADEKKSKKDNYLFVKSGSLSNNYNLSGYLKTKDGKYLIFSFMVNHFMGSNRPIRNKIKSILDYVHKTY